MIFLAFIMSLASSIRVTGKLDSSAANTLLPFFTVYVKLRLPCAETNAATLPFEAHCAVETHVIIATCKSRH
jgi:hypothetical protein